MCNLICSHNVLFLVHGNLMASVSGAAVVLATALTL
jgi:hypothetical protein